MWDLKLVKGTNWLNWLDFFNDARTFLVPGQPSPTRLTIQTSFSSNPGRQLLTSKKVKGVEKDVQFPKKHTCQKCV